ncbi:MAG TPA: aspartate aminotransferase family protein [Solirubrobacterales bacterium]|nr:aspartate aminotransferase family protein [Solirubrobacterales bacterium]
MEDRLQSLAKQHLMLHFTDMASLVSEGTTIIDRGEGCFVFDTEGRRYIDGLSGLYCVNLGHSHGEEIAIAASAQMARLPFTSNWTVAHPPAIELAAKLAELAPAGLERVFFTSGGAESVESAWKMAVQFHRSNGEPARRKVIARQDAYHGVTMGALAMTGLEECRAPFEPFGVPAVHVSNTNAYRHPDGADPARMCAALLAEVEGTIEREGAETIAMLIAEPVQNAGGCLVPPDGYWQGLRELCDRHGILLVSDEVICAFGRIGAWFGAQRLGYEPDMITFAKGLTGAHFPMGGVLISERVAEPFVEGREMYLHGITFGGHPVGSAVALASIEIFERENVLDNVMANEPLLRDLLNGLRDIPIVGDVRGIGQFWAIELVRDQETRATFEGPAAEWLLKDVLSAELWGRGLVCRLDDRTEPIVQIAPPLVADRETIEEIATILREGLTVAAERMTERPELTPTT